MLKDCLLTDFLVVFTQGAFEWGTEQLYEARPLQSIHVVIQVIQNSMCLTMAVQVMANLCINPRWKITRRLLRVWCWEQKPWISYRGVNLASVGLKRII